MYVCVYVSMYVCMYAYMYACMYACIHVCKYVCMYVCMYICKSATTCKQTYIHAYTHTYIHAYIHTYMQTYIHTYIHTYILTYMHTDLHTYMHTYMCHATLRRDKRPAMQDAAHLSLPTEWPRLIGSLIFISHFPQKWPIFSGSFVENDLHITGSYESLPPCTFTWLGKINMYESCHTYEADKRPAIEGTMHIRRLPPHGWLKRQSIST